jgi:hypothetical protein
MAEPQRRAARCLAQNPRTLWDLAHVPVLRDAAGKFGREAAVETGEAFDVLAARRAREAAPV